MYDSMTTPHDMDKLFILLSLGVANNPYDDNLFINTIFAHCLANSSLGFFLGYEIGNILNY